MIEVEPVEATKEEIDAIIAIGKAMREGDRETELRLAPLIKLRPDTLMAMKKICGAEFIREERYNTERADKHFGPGWLDA